ncbi:hypothetical protein ABDK00_017840 [Niabella insulamsoli]|uniref:hypothetical protein n=1 Tax=Niabella insulamsoli TaxID=3144874 RepID=UPI0031FD81B8
MPWSLSLLFILFCFASCDDNYITQTETRTVRSGRVKTETVIIKKLRKKDKKPVSVLTRSSTPHAASQSLDSLYYDDQGRHVLTRTFRKENGNWTPISAVKP